MKFSKSIIHSVTILLMVALVVINASAKEGSLGETTPTPPKDDFSLGSATAVLKPPNTNSPRATLKSFIENMNRAYRVLMKAHHKNLKTPGFFPSESVRQMAKQAEEYFESGVECLDLSQVPKNLKKDVGYDTDVDKVRKIIKKINKKIMKDKEMGLVMLDKIKSQGVRELDDSAMIMRVKFKTIPGEQFVIRREVFRMMQEAFHENGIEIAHRNVTVYLPPGESDNSPDKKAIEGGAVAGVAAKQAEAQRKKRK